MTLSSSDQSFFFPVVCSSLLLLKIEDFYVCMLDNAETLNPHKYSNHRVIIDTMFSSPFCVSFSDNSITLTAGKCMKVGE